MYKAVLDFSGPSRFEENQNSVFGWISRLILAQWVGLGSTRPVDYPKPQT